MTAQDIELYPWAYDERPFHLILNLTLGRSPGGKIEKSDPQGNLLVYFIRVKPLEC